MEQKTIYFRTRGGSTQGWGNIIRLGAFAEYCRQKGHSNILFFVEGPVEVLNYIKNLDFRIIKLPEDISLDDEFEIFNKQPNADVIIMEMLDCNYYRQAMLKKYSNKLVVFDDLLDHIYCADIVVCGQALPNYDNKEISSKETTFLVGLEYFLSRPEFKPYLEKKRTYSGFPENALVILGGGRYDVAYLKIAHAFSMFKNKITPTFILGYANNKNLINEISRILPNAKICEGVRNIDEMLWLTDFAFVSGGYTKIEAAITATPAIIIAVQYHQIPLAEKFSELTRFPYVGYMSFVDIKRLQDKINEFLFVRNRQDVGDNVRSLIDGKGFDRVYNSIFLS